MTALIRPWDVKKIERIMFYKGNNTKFSGAVSPWPSR